MRRILASAVLLICWRGDALAQQPTPPAAPSSLSRKALEDEVLRLRSFVQGGVVRGQRPAGCSSPAQHQFDFWLGEWDVSPSLASANAAPPILIAESSISLHAQGCVILEHWRPFRSGHGHSINFFDSAAGLWRQTYADANGTHTVFEGLMGDDAIMRLNNLGPPPVGSPAGQRRMSFQQIDADTVRQWGEVMDVPTGTWTMEWEFIYRRRIGTR